jgi:hypothetical protein
MTLETTASITRRDPLGSPARPSEILTAEAAGDGMIRSTPHPRSVPVFYGKLTR